jgi:hypothetical protein
MLTPTRAPTAARHAVQKYASAGRRGAGRSAAGALITLSSRKYVLPIRWSGRTVTFLKPRFVGWQHLVAARGPAVRVTTRARGRTHRVAWVSVGPFANAAAAALEALEIDPRWRGRPFTAASLSISPLMVQALWLRSRRGDRFWILAPSHPAAVRNRPLTRRQFEASLRRVYRALSIDVSDVRARLSDTSG